MATLQGPLLLATALFVAAGCAGVPGLSDLGPAERERARGAGEMARSAVVLLEPGPRYGGGYSSGVIVHPEGLVLGCGHGVSRLEDETHVLLPDGRRLTAHRLWQDRDRDLAVWGIEEPGPYPYLEVSVRALEPGEVVLKAGRDSDGEFRWAVGRVLPPGDPQLFDIRHSAAVYPVDSGSPLLDLYGTVVGVNVAATGELAFTPAPGEEGYFASASLPPPEQVLMDSLDAVREIRAPGPTAAPAPAAPAPPPR